MLLFWLWILFLLAPNAFLSWFTWLAEKSLVNRADDAESEGNREAYWGWSAIYTVVIIVDIADFALISFDPSAGIVKLLWVPMVLLGLQVRRWAMASRSSSEA